MIEVYENLFVGDSKSCSYRSDLSRAVIHACKHPCHVESVGYKGSLPSDHPYYLFYENGKHLFLNMVDMEREFHPRFTNPMMKVAMYFIEKYIVDNQVLVHCNQGQSRSPSIALVYLALKNVLNPNSYGFATMDFKKRYPNYDPGNGIAMYLENNWDFLMNISVQD